MVRLSSRFVDPRLVPDHLKDEKFFDQFYKNRWNERGFERSERFTRIKILRTVVLFGITFFFFVLF